MNLIASDLTQILVAELECSLGAIMYMLTSMFYMPALTPPTITSLDRLTTCQAPGRKKKNITFILQQITLCHYNRH